MRRRQFIKVLMAGMGAAGAVPRALSAEAQRRRRAARAARPAPGPLDRVCIFCRSFDSRFEVAPGSDIKSPAERAVLLDFPQRMADRYKVHNVEFAAPHFASLDPVYLQALKTNLAAAHSKLINVAVDVKELAAGGGLSDPDAAVRTAALDAAKQWIDIAHRLGARSVSCKPGAMSPDDLSLTVDSYRKLAGYGRARAVTVLMESKGGPGSPQPEAIEKVLRAVGGAFVGALPEFGGLADNPARLSGLFRYARTLCRASSPKAAADQGPQDSDLRQCVQVAKAAGFRGVYSIEYTSGGDADAGVEGVIDELVKDL